VPLVRHSTIERLIKESALLKFVAGTPIVLVKGEDPHMEISAATSTTAVAAIVQQLQAVNEAQMAIMSQMASAQQDFASMLAAMGIGQNINIQV
jgi:hypothetical protein